MNMDVKDEGFSQRSTMGHSRTIFVAVSPKNILCETDSARDIEICELAESVDGAGNNSPAWVFF